MIIDVKNSSMVGTSTEKDLYLEIFKLQRENQQLKEMLFKNEKLQNEVVELLYIVYGISVGYDGFNDVCGLKGVIDDMAKYTCKAIKVLDNKESEGKYYE